MLNLRLNPDKDENFMFIDPTSGIILNLLHNKGVVEKTTPLLLRGIRSKVLLVDNTPPVISAIDKTIPYGSKWSIDLHNVSVMDFEEGDITQNIVVTQNVNTKVPKKYPVKISITDKLGSSVSKTVYATVQEKPNTPPTITANDATIDAGTPWNKSLHNPVANDIDEGPISIDRITTNPATIDTTNAREVQITFTVKDNKNATASVTRKLTINAVTPPDPPSVTDPATKSKTKSTSRRKKAE